MYNDYPTIYETNLNEYLIFYIILGTIILGIFILTLISLAKIFKKANRSGISAFIPFYNNIVLLEITNLPKIYFILLLIPGVNIVFNMLIMFELAKLFRKGKSFGLGLSFVPFVFYPILAFDKSEYIGINLVAKENKSTVVELPKVVNEEENPVINESFDDKNKNINISIGGGVYQKDYTKKLINIDEKQIIVDKNTNINKEDLNIVPQENKKEATINNKIENTDASIDNKNESTDVNLDNNLSYIELMSNGIGYNENTINVTNQEVSVFNQTTNVKPVNNNAIEYIDCPQCGAKIKKGAGVCFLCGKKLD